MPFVLLRRARCQLDSHVAGPLYGFERFDGLEGFILGRSLTLNPPDTLEVLVPEGSQLVREDGILVLSYPSPSGEGDCLIPAWRVAQLAWQERDGFAIHYDPETPEFSWPPRVTQLLEDL